MADYDEARLDYSELEQVEPVSMEEAQDIHDIARALDSGHDQSPCFCCCMDCDFTPEDVY